MTFNSKKASRKVSNINDLQKVAISKKQLSKVKGGGDGGETVEIIIQEELDV